MADHRAEQILAAVTTALTGLTTTGSNVKRAQVFDFTDSVTDALIINMGQDIPVSERNIEFLDSILTVEITIFTKNTSLDTRVNLIKKEIIAALMAAPRTLGLSFVIDIVESGFQKPEYQAADTRIGECT